MICRNTLSPRLYFSIHHRRSHRYYLSKLIPRYCTTRYILCCRPFPLCFVNRSCFCHYRGLCPLIPFIFRLHIRPNLCQSPLYYYIHRRKFNLFSTTLPWPIRNTPTLFWLPRCLYHMKYSIVHWLFYFTSSSNPNNLHDLRGLRLKTQSINGRTIPHQPRMIKWLSPALPHIWRTNLH